MGPQGTPNARLAELVHGLTTRVRIVQPEQPHELDAYRAYLPGAQGVPRTNGTESRDRHALCIQQSRFGLLTGCQ